LLWAAIAAVVGVAVLVPMHLPLYAALGVLGLLLGATNARMAQVAVARYSDPSSYNRGQFAMGVLGRLCVISVIALGCAILLRPAGLAVFAGLAIFQLLTIVSAMLPLVKEIRQ
jgi:cobalamin synthase